MIKLKDGTKVVDRRLGRLVDFDSASRAFPIRQLVVDKEPRAYTWRCTTHLNQGTEGSCVGHGIAHELAARPAEVKGLTHRFATEQIYWEAQKLDRWKGGSYPGAEPFYEGTSVLAGIKVAQRMGFFETYRWAFGLQDLILGVGYNGPAVMGTNWYEGMHTPEPNGRVHVTGRATGGHCYLIDQVIPHVQLFGGLNSWGNSWGLAGRFYISFDDMQKLLDADGEAAFFIKRHRQPED